jgi:hypothetical protein
MQSPSVLQRRQFCSSVNPRKLPQKTPHPVVTRQAAAVFARLQRAGPETLRAHKLRSGVQAPSLCPMPHSDHNRLHSVRWLLSGAETCGARPVAHPAVTTIQHRTPAGHQMIGNWPRSRQTCPGAPRTSAPAHWSKVLIHRGRSHRGKWALLRLWRIACCPIVMPWSRELRHSCSSERAMSRVWDALALGNVDDRQRDEPVPLSGAGGRARCA